VLVLDENAIRRMVRRVVYRTLGKPLSEQPAPGRPLITESHVREVQRGGTLIVPARALITPLASQVALERSITLEPAGASQASRAHLDLHAEPSVGDGKVVAIGADHGGFQLKQSLKAYLGELGYSVVDCGTDSTASVDYPDFAFAVARLVAQGHAWRGVIVDGAGIGSCMAANKVPGVRAAMCYDQATAVNSREHNDANVLTLGAGLIGPSLARQITKSWLETPAGGERHARRVEKIMQIERRFLQTVPKDS
jgi:ribose 5-phosphate isomerase B